ncbi:3-dehydroquinate synthase [Flavobacterium agricola]|uniref:3-dehydroquinate synthase n=1 Tax=Flavobacterium agricola TaxID=2870839 RepID=A0ABY6M242_9FLAO|nr:3-dehydroquinate synthase [Flavobacterium agricola]UYW02606.1 3-dehydroquinate synthase [Flavobacterium agricola]
MQQIISNNHSVFFNEDCFFYLSDALKDGNYSKIFILADSETVNHCVPSVLSNMQTNIPFEIIEFDAGEEYKTMETCMQIWNVLIELGADRKSVIINVGGGVVTDLGGFVASVFKRGIDFINIPTSLLAMVDASVGGKNGIDLGALKNQIGTITNPKAVLIHTGFLETLPQVQMRSGLAEMLKHGLIQDAEYWQLFKHLDELTTEHLDALIYRSVEIKNNVVTQDLTETGIRKALNFGHTLGHAIESYCLENQAMPTLLHGEAIAVGMILESYLSLEKQFITYDQYLDIKTTLNNLYDKVNFNEAAINEIVDLLIYDKKNEFGKIQFCLLNGIGDVMLDQQVSNELIYNAFKDYEN